MSNLSRAALLCYPRWWRETRGEEVVGLLMDSAEANGRRRPSLADLLNLAAHGLKLRAGTSARISSQLRNRVAVIALAMLTAICATMLIFGEWAPWDPRTSLEASPIGNVTTGSVCFVLGLLAAVAVALGRPTVARWLAACCGLTALVIMWAPVEQLAHGYGFTRPPGAILAFVAALCALVSVGEPLLPRRLFLVLAASSTVGAVLVTALSLGPEPWFYYRSPEQISLRIGGGILLGVALLVIAVVLLIGGSRTWAPALAANAAPWLMLFTLDPHLGGIAYWPMGSVVGLLGAVIAVALLIGLAAVAVGRRSQPSRSSLASNE